MYSVLQSEIKENEAKIQELFLDLEINVFMNKRIDWLKLQ